MESELYPIKTGEFEGYINSSGEIVIEPKYDFASVFYYGLAKVGMLESTEKKSDSDINHSSWVPPKWWLINKNERLASDKSFDTILPFQEGVNYIGAKKDGRWFFIKRYFDFKKWQYRISILAEPSFDDVDIALSDEMVGVKAKGKWGFVDLDTLDSFYHHGLENGLNTPGLFSIAPQYANVHPFSEGLASVFFEEDEQQSCNSSIEDVVGHSFFKTVKGKWGFIDKRGRIVIKPDYDYASVFKNGIAIVTKDWGKGCINKKGRYVVRPMFDEIYPFEKGVAIVKINNKYHFFRSFLIPKSTIGLWFFKLLQRLFKLGYDEARPFKDGLSAVKKGDKWGYINLKRRCVIKPVFDEAHSFIGELAPVECNGKFNYINKRGEVVWTSDYFPFVWYNGKNGEL